MLSASCFALHRLQKKNGKFSKIFSASGCQKCAFGWGETDIFKSHQMKTSKIKCFFLETLMTKIAFSLRRKANFHSWLMRLPSKNDHDFEMSFYQVPQIPRFQFLTPKSWISNRQPLTGRRINRLPCFCFFHVMFVFLHHGHLVVNLGPCWQVDM